MIYYVGRGIALAVLPLLLSADTTPGIWVFILFYGLGRDPAFFTAAALCVLAAGLCRVVPRARVQPSVALTRDESSASASPRTSVSGPARQQADNVS